MPHYAMIPMDEYQEFMHWKNKKRVEKLYPESRKTTLIENDDFPF